MTKCRVILVIDADHFEVQVYQKRDEYAHTIGKPCVVAIRNANYGRIVSISPEAKSAGVTRQDKVGTAKQKCPKLIVIAKNRKFTKPDVSQTDRYSYDMRSAILKFRKKYIYDACPSYDIDANIEKIGNDEYFVDLTEFVDAITDDGKYADIDTSERAFLETEEKYYKGRQLANRLRKFHADEDNSEEEEVRLACGLEIGQDLCAYIFKKTQIVCSGGIASNKLLAKLACKYRKPDAVTALTRGGFDRISPNIVFSDVTGFGGDLGIDIASIFGNVSLEELRSMLKSKRNFNYLAKKVGPEKANLAKRLVHGVCHEDVMDKLMFDGLNCGSHYFKDKSAGEFRTALHHLSQNMIDRLKLEVQYNKRFAERIEIQYIRRTTGPRDKLHSFNMDFNPVTDVDYENEGTIKIELAEFFANACSAVIHENDHFLNHLPHICKINFSVTRFENFGQVDEN